MNLIEKLENIKDLGITMSTNCNFNQHINNVYKQCPRLSGRILKTYISRDSLTLLPLFKCIVLSRLDYVHSYGVHTKLNLSIRLNKSKDLSPGLLLECDPYLMMRGTSLHLYSVQRRFERSIIIYIRKILESIVHELCVVSCWRSG